MIKELLIRLSLLLGLFALGAVIINRYADRSPIVINEVCSSNFAARCNDNGDYSDCIELYNSGGTDFSLNGCFLTDDDNEPEKYALDGITIPAKSYTLIWLNQESAFRISKDGDQLFLVTPVMAGRRTAVLNGLL